MCLGVQFVVDDCAPAARLFLGQRLADVLGSRKRGRCPHSAVSRRAFVGEHALGDLDGLPVGPVAHATLFVQSMGCMPLPSRNCCDPRSNQSCTRPSHSPLRCLTMLTVASGSESLRLSALFRQTSNTLS